VQFHLSHKFLLIIAIYSFALYARNRASLLAYCIQIITHEIPKANSSPKKPVANHYSGCLYNHLTGRFINQTFQFLSYADNYSFTGRAYLLLAFLQINWLVRKNLNTMMTVLFILSIIVFIYLLYVLI